MKATIKWLDGVSFEGVSESGHSVVMDGAPESGGKNLGMRPMEMLLLGLGGCTSYDVVTILKKSRQDVKDCSAEITAERAENIPKVFTKIHIHFILEGNDLDEFDEEDDAEEFDGKVNEFRNVLTDIKKGVTKNIEPSKIDTNVVPESILAQVKEQGPEIRSLLSKGEE